MKVIMIQQQEGRKEERRGAKRGDEINEQI